MAPLLALSAFVAAEQPITVVASPAALATDACDVPVNSFVDFDIVEHLGSKLSHPGDIFHIRTSRVIDATGRPILPEGMTGTGEVIHAARARAGGKAGELILSVRYLDCGDKRIPLRRFRFGRSGESENDVAFAVALLAGPLAYLIVGGEVDVPTGTHGYALVSGAATPSTPTRP